MRILINNKYYTFTGIKQAVTDSKNAHNYYRVYCDYNSGKVWTVEYESSNNWSDYHNNDIYEILSGYGYRSIFGLTRVTMEDVKQAIINSLPIWQDRKVMYNN